MTRSRPIIGITTYEKEVSHNPTITLVGIMIDYKNALLAAGALPIMLPLGLSNNDISEIIQHVDGLVVPGGGDIDPARYGGDVDYPIIRGIDRRRDDMEIHIIQEAVARDLPLLAICRGHQVFNVALGGTLWEDVRTDMPNAIDHDYYRVGVERNLLPHTVDVTAGSKLNQLLGTEQTRVNSLHHQGVRRIASDLRATAVAPDGLVEALELPTHRFALSVQWHPENLVGDDPAMLNLFRGLVEAA